MVTRAEFNYVRWVLLLMVIAAGYWGWKIGPGVWKRIQAQQIADSCAAKMWTTQDLQIRRDFLEAEMGRLGVPASDKDFFVKFDRTANNGKTRTCELQFKYRNQHVWGAPIEKTYKVKGVSSRTGKI